MGYIRRTFIHHHSDLGQIQHLILLLDDFLRQQATKEPHHRHHSPLRVLVHHLLCQLPRPVPAYQRPGVIIWIFRVLHVDARAAPWV